MTSRLRKINIALIRGTSAGIVSWLAIIFAASMLASAARGQTTQRIAITAPAIIEVIAPPAQTTQPSTQPALKFLDVKVNDGPGLFGTGQTLSSFLINAYPRTNAIFLTGTGNTVRDGYVFGGENAIALRDATNATIDGVTVRRANYAVFLNAFSKPENRGVTISNFDFDATGGEHGIRLYATRDAFIGPGKIVHNGPYKGACLNIRQGTNITIRGVTTGGIANGDGFGPDPSERREDLFTVDGLVVEDCELNETRTIQFFPRCNAASFKRCKINLSNPGVAVIGVWSGASATFTDCMLIGGSGPGNATFVNSTWNGSPVN